MQSQFLRAINELCEEKNLSKEIVFETVKAALRAAYRKDYGNRDQNIEVEFNDGETFATIFLIKEVVKTIENEDQQISLKEAQKNSNINILFNKFN